MWRNNQSNAITTDSALAQAWSSRGDSVAKIVLACAHIYDHRPEAASLLNLAALCQRCHNRHDAQMRAAGRRRRAELASAQ